MLCVIDEFTRECLAIEVGASLRSQDVILTLSRLMRLYGKPTFVRSDKRHNQALIALARRRCDALFAMLRDGTIYQPNSAANA
ncbi:transposase [Burkholderia lata]|nr:transposase [Burkholderia lata]